MLASINASSLVKDASLATRCARHLSGAYRTTGQLLLALKYANESVRCARTSGDLFEHTASWTTVGHVLHQLGRLSRAEKAFVHAETIQVKGDPARPFLSSYPCFRYCELLLELGRYTEVVERVDRQLGCDRERYPIYNDARDYVIRGWAQLLIARQQSEPDFSGAEADLTKALLDLRATGDLHTLPLGLLAHAELQFCLGNLKEAQSELENALTITRRGGIRLYEADCHLALARVHLATRDTTAVADHLACGERLVREMRYHRRDRDVAEIKIGLR
jgi:tetratricopeptide (TPR) repeat protein